MPRSLTPWDALTIGGRHGVARHPRQRNLGAAHAAALRDPDNSLPDLSI